MYSDDADDDAHAALLRRFAAEEARGVELLDAILPRLVAHVRAMLPGEPEQERLQRLGDALWLVFSNNADVVCAAGEVCSLGSWRGTGGALADALEPYGFAGDYLSFYMADAHGYGYGYALLRAVLRPVFAELRGRGYDWHIEREVKGAVPTDAEAEAMLSARYAALDAHTAKYGLSLERLGDEEVRVAFDALDARHPFPLPAAAAAYHDVYGRLPERVRQR